MEQCLAYIEKYDQEGVEGHTCPRENALLELAWDGYGLAKGWQRQKICQLPIHNSSLVIILTNFHLFLERCAPLDLAKSTCLYLPRKTLISVLETLEMFPLYFANSENSLSACFLYFISCRFFHYIHFFGLCLPFSSNI